MACQEAWDGRDVERLSTLVGDDLLVEWKRRLDDFEAKGWHNRVSVLAPPQIEYVGLVNREDDTEDRAVVRITASLRAFVEDGNGHRIMRKRVEDGEGDAVRVLDAGALRRRGVEGGVDRAAGGGRPPPGCGDRRLTVVGHAAACRRVARRARGGGRATAGVYDGGPGGGVVRRNARASRRSTCRWRTPASPQTCWRRQRGGRWRRGRRRWTGTTRRWRRSRRPRRCWSCCTEATSRAGRAWSCGARGCGEIRIVAVDVSREPATMTIEVEVGGRRYVEDRDTAAVVSGSKERAGTFSESVGAARSPASESPLAARTFPVILDQLYGQCARIRPCAPSTSISTSGPRPSCAC